MIPAIIVFAFLSAPEDLGRQAELRAELQQLQGCAAKFGDERNSIHNELAQLLLLRKSKRSK